MHPAFSLIFFTTASGAGYGMLAWIGVLGYFGLLPFGPVSAATAFGVALALVTAGLLSSTFHLGHPERAWRSFSQWRSSWLSREGVAAVATYVPALTCLAGWFFALRGSLAWDAVDLLLAVMALVTVFTTSMIYASLRTVPAWHDRLVPPAYLVLSLATGGVWLSAVLAFFAPPPALLVIVTVIALAAGLAVKLAYWSRRAAAAPRATARSATGLGRIGTVRQLESPHSAGNWVVTEMAHAVARRRASALRKVAVAAGFVLPAVLLVAAAFTPPALAFFLALAAVLLAALGTVAERWLFFAEAQHVVTLYYGRQQA